MLDAFPSASTLIAPGVSSFAHFQMGKIKKARESLKATAVGHGLICSYEEDDGTELAILLHYRKMNPPQQSNVIRFKCRIPLLASFQCSKQSKERAQSFTNCYPRKLYLFLRRVPRTSKEKKNKKR